jgi:hypothetical protein
MRIGIVTDTKFHPGPDFKLEFVKTTFEIPGAVEVSTKENDMQGQGMLPGQRNPENCAFQQRPHTGSCDPGEVGYGPSSVPGDRGMPDDQPQGMQAHRPHARHILKLKIRELRQRAEALQALADQLPAVLSPQADEALYRLLNGSL